MTLRTTITPRFVSAVVIGLALSASSTAVAEITATQSGLGNSQTATGDVLVVGPDGLISQASDATPTGSSGAKGASVSADGLLVSFESADDALDRIPNGVSDIFVRDRSVGVTNLVSSGFDGRSPNGNSFGARMSAEGRYVGFTSDASNLVSRNGRDPLDTDDLPDAFVYDLITGITRLVSATGPDDQPSRLIDISDDGTIVLVAHDDSTLVRIDWSENRTVEIGQPARRANDGPAAAMSGDGQRIVYLDDDAKGNQGRRVVVVDVAADTERILAVEADDADDAEIAGHVTITADGDHVLFARRAAASDGFEILLQELDDDLRPFGDPEVVSVRSDGDPVDAMVDEPVFVASRDAATIAFATNAAVTDDDDRSRQTDVFVNRRTDPDSVTFRASLESHGFGLVGFSTLARNGRSISDDGQTVVFHSAALLVSLDDNSVEDVFAATPASTCAGRFVSVFLASGEKPTSGDDVILGTRRNDRIDALGGDDVVCGADGNDFILGGDGNDLLHGDGGKDVLEGGAGRDLIYGHEGDDKLYGDEGHDRIWGGRGDDLVVGNSGKDKLQGDAGDDRILGGKGKDNLKGGVGDDVLLGGGSNDVLLGKAGNDTLNGGDGRDSLRGGTGDDTLDGGDAVDRLNGGSGIDECVESTDEERPDKLQACE